MNRARQTAARDPSPDRVPRALAISAGTARGADDCDEWLERLVTAEIPAVQLREKHLSDGVLYTLALRLRTRLPVDCRVIVNGRFDIALAAGADGVHLPADGLSVGAVRAHCGDDLLIGRSTHRLEEIDRARNEGADYVTFGPLRPVPGKEAYGPAAGFDGLRSAAELGLPVLALGGVGLADLGPLLASGVHGVAAIRLFQDPATLTSAAGLLSALPPDRPDPGSRAPGDGR